MLSTIFTRLVIEEEIYLKKKEKKKHTGPFFLKRSKQQKERRLCDWSALEPGLKVFLLIFVGGTGGFWGSSSWKVGSPADGIVFFVFFFFRSFPFSTFPFLHPQPPFSGYRNVSAALFYSKSTQSSFPIFVIARRSNKRITQINVYIYVYIMQAIVFAIKWSGTTVWYWAGW